MRLSLSSAVLLAFALNALPAVAQDDLNSAVLRTMNCRLSDGFTVSDIVTAARAFPRDANSPDLVFVREGTLASPQFTENWDFQVATLYPSYQEMAARRSARTMNPLASEQVSPADMSTCGTPRISERYNVRVRALSDSSSMVTRLCEVTDTSRVAAYSRISELADNFSAEGADLLVTMDFPGVGGPLDLTNLQFILRVVGPD